MSYHIRQISRARIKNPVLIEGLPGIGNVGKVAVDFIIDNLDAKLAYEITSDSFPHAVFVNEDNLVELPTIKVYHKKIKNQDILLLAGDVQPVDESSCYEFCNKTLDLMQKFKGKEVVTLGGIGLQQIPKIPKVYCTANDKSIIKKYQARNLKSNLYGVVGPIVGVSGLLVGLSKQRRIPSIALLAETFGHPSYLGIKGAREILSILNNKLKLGLNLKQLDEEISEIEEEVKEKNPSASKLQSKSRTKKGFTGEIDYIG